MESVALLHAKSAGLPFRARLHLRLRLPLPRPRAPLASFSAASKHSTLQSPLLASRSHPSQDAILGYGLLKRRTSASGGVSCSAQAVAVPQPEGKKFLGVDVQTLKKIVPLGLMFFCILFNYTILRDTKDVLVVTAKGSSAEI